MHVCLTQWLILFLIDKGYFVAFIIRVKYIHFLKSEEKKSKKKLTHSPTPAETTIVDISSNLFGYTTRCFEFTDK